MVPAMAAERPKVLPPVLEKQVLPPLRLGVTRILYLAMCMGFLVIHIDDGILSIASEYIIRDLKFTEGDIGLIEAAVYLGITLGCLLCPILYSKFSPKVILIFGVFATSCCVSVWIFTNSFWVLVTCRLLNGVFLVSIIFRRYLMYTSIKIAT